MKKTIIFGQFKYLLYFCKSYHLIAIQYGSVAQLNRASDSGSEGHGFESHRSHLITYRILLFSDYQLLSGYLISNNIINRNNTDHQIQEELAIQTNNLFFFLLLPSMLFLFPVLLKQFPDVFCVFPLLDKCRQYAIFHS